MQDKPHEFYYYIDLYTIQQDIKESNRLELKEDIEELEDDLRYFESIEEYEECELIRVEIIELQILLIE